MNAALATPTLHLDGRRCTIRLYGVLDATTVHRLNDLVVPDASTELLIDLLEVTNCTPDARKHLVTLASAWKRTGRRTAWLADRAALRGTALWVMHHARDDHSKAVGTSVQADRWLAGTGTRISVSLAQLGVSTRRSS